MARKRMISPSIWESESFSELSDFAKIVFISLISHADDEGRGKAKAATVRSMTFPNDADRRVADVEKALSEIALKMSVQFYSVDGREYYVMTNWLDYQKIDKPTKSKFPPPPNVGVGGDIPNREQFGEDSASIRGVVDEDSTPKSSQVNISQDNNNLYDSQTGAELEFYMSSLKDHLADSQFYEEDKARILEIAAEVTRRKSLKINGVDTPAAKVIQSFIYLCNKPRNAVSDLICAGEKDGVKNKLLYTVAAMYNGALGF